MRKTFIQHKTFKQIATDTIIVVVWGNDAVFTYLFSNKVQEMDDLLTF